MENSQKWLSLRFFVAMGTVCNILMLMKKKSQVSLIMVNIHCKCEALKPKGETNSSFLVLHPSSGVHTVKTVGSHLKLTKKLSRDGVKKYCISLLKWCCETLRKWCSLHLACSPICSCKFDCIFTQNSIISCNQTTYGLLYIIQ